MAVAALGQDDVESWFLTRTGIQGSWPTLPLGTVNKEPVKYTDQMEMTPIDWNQLHVRPLTVSLDLLSQINGCGRRAMERKQNNLFSLKLFHTSKPQFLQLKKNVYSQIKFFPLFFFFRFESLQFRRHTVVQFQRSLTNTDMVDFVRYSSHETAG